MTGMRIGGLASGMDIDKIVGDLMKAERMPLDKLFQKKTTYEWQRDAFRSINTKLSTYDRYLFDNFSLTSNFFKKTVSGTNDALVSAVATSAASSSLSIEGVAQLATAARQVGNTFTTSSGGTAVNTTTMSELGIANTTIKIKSIQADGTLPKEATEIKINSTDTIAQVMSKINSSNAGVSVLFENGRLSVTAKNTGDIKGGAEVQVIEGSDVFAKMGLSVTNGELASGGKNAIFQVNGIATERSSNTFTISGYTVTLKSTFNNKLTLQENVNRLEAAKLSAEQDVIDAQNQLSAAETNEANKKSDFDSVKTPEYETLITSYPGLKNALVNINGDTDPSTESDFDKFKALADHDDATIDSSDISADAKKVLKSLTAEEREALGQLTADEFNNLKPIAQKNVEWEIAQLDLKRAQDNLAAKEARRTQINAEYDAAKAELDNYSATDPVVPPVQLTASTDIDSMVEKIKEFVSKYNELISGMNDQLKEKKYRDYPPLTDEQRKDMSEKEQELWDEKAKSGLLRNDSIISGGLADMRNSIYGKVGSELNIIDTFAEMGITTSSSYNDGGKLVIDEDKLRKALTENPDHVVKTFSQSGEKTDVEDTRGIVQRLRDSIKDLTKNIEKRAGKDSFTDQQYDLGKRLIDTNDRISNFQRRLEDIESRYWRQFTAMEQAISRANQQSAMLMGQTTG